MSFQNVYHLRTVAETSSKGCMICYKPTTAVLITPDQKDFFYVCTGHLKDRGFATPIVDPPPKPKTQEELMREEIDKVTREHKEKLAAKEKGKDDKEKKEGDSKDADKKDEKDDGKEKQAEMTKKETGTDIHDDPADKFGTKSKETAGSSSISGNTATDPRIFALHRSFYQMRLDKLRQAEMAKRNRERLSNPSFFPSAPSGFP